MKLSNTIKISFRNILKNKVRSFLTSLGIIIGVCSVTVMVGIGQGTQNKIKNEIASLGTNLIMIFPGSNRFGGVQQGMGSVNRLTLDDVERLKRDTSYIQSISPLVATNKQVVFGGFNWRTTINGVSPEYQAIREYNVTEGEFFKESDVKVSKSVAVIGSTIVAQLFKDIDPVGQSIRIGKIPFKVIGVLESKGKSGFGADQDDVILAPYTTVMNKLNNNRFLRSILISTTSPDLISQEQDEIQKVLRDQHKINSADPDDFSMGNQTEIADRASSIAVTLTLLLGSIAAVSLIVGGIGIMNIMLVSVTERTREIGTRMAVGARGKDIMLQFLIESFVLSMIGGIIGIMASLIIAFFMNTFTSISLEINFNIVAIACIFSGAVGLFFGIYPARKAANLNPIDALRYE